MAVLVSLLIVTGCAVFAAARFGMWLAGMS